jgi:hypothetical protein
MSKLRDNSQALIASIIECRSDREKPLDPLADQVLQVILDVTTLVMALERRT